VPVAVQVGDANAERGRELCFRGQGNSFKMVPAIEENHRGQRVGLQLASARQFIREHAGDRGLRKRHVRGEFRAHERQGRGNRAEISAGHDTQDLVIVSLDQIDTAGLSQIAKIKPHRKFAGGLVRAIEAPVAGDDVQAAVAIQITGGDPGPPAGELIEG